MNSGHALTASFIANDYVSSPGSRGLPEGHVPVRRHVNTPIFDGDRKELLHSDIADIQAFVSEVGFHNTADNS